MTDYTPTTEQIRSAFANRAYTDAGVDEFLVQFDRWLKAHDRAVAAKAWDEGFDKCAEYVNGPDWAPAPPNPYRAYFLADEREGAGERFDELGGA